MISADIEDRWKHYRDESIEQLRHENRTRDEKRTRAQTEILELLHSYLRGAIDTQTFRTVFDRKSRTEWDLFGLKGMSAAMYLNVMVKHIPNQEELAHQLKTVFALPTTVEDGKQRMLQYRDYILSLIQGDIVRRNQLQPARIPYLVSAFWHLQDTQTWPIYYESGRKVLEAEGLYQPAPNSVESYFQFREVFVGLAQALELSSWDLEHLLVARYEAKVTIAPPVEPIQAVAAPESQEMAKHPVAREKSGEEEKAHSHIQWLLARMGQKFGYKVWIASNDRKRLWHGETLGTYSIEELPHLNGVGRKSQRMIELIDVVWLKGSSKIVAAFEVESTTSIFSGLLRMSDLTVALENVLFPIYIAVPNARLKDVREQLSRLTFQRLELHQRCRFFAFEDLIDNGEAIMKFATDVNAIDQIAQQVGDIDDTDY